MFNFIRNQVCKTMNICILLIHNLSNLDLAEVMSVSQANPTPGAPKKTDDKSFFDVSSYCCFLTECIL